MKHIGHMDKQKKEDTQKTGNKGKKREDGNIEKWEIKGRNK